MEVIRIKYDKDEITKKTKEVEVCFKCSACSIFCPITLNSKKYDLENAFIAQLFKGDNPDILNDVWMCCACEKCVVVCPQDADPTEVFTNLKQLSYQEGSAPDIIYGLVKQVVNTGSAYEISKSTNAQRKKLNLSEIEPNEAVAKELKIIAEHTALKIKEDA